ncbi:hypothetical protein [Asaia sp. HN010]|uniref:hypothetical protein n=1 Tax=Asaia sp. HN010 TaxID=3081233 RepID=UPI00301A9B02
MAGRRAPITGGGSCLGRAVTCAREGTGVAIHSLLFLTSDLACPPKSGEAGCGVDQSISAC